MKLDRGRQKIIAGFAVFVWLTTVFARSYALGDLAYTPDRLAAIAISFLALTAFGIAVGRLWDSHDD